MGLYYGLIALVGGLELAFRKIDVKDKRKCKLVIMYAATVLLQGLRAPTVGNDLKNYIYALSLSREGAWTTPLMGFEIGFRMLLHLLSVLGISEQVFIFLTAFICQAPIFYFIYKESTCFWESLLIYYTFGMFTFSFSGIRQFLAMGIFLIAIVWLNEGKKRRFVLATILASTIHTSAIVGLIALPLSKTRIRQKGKLLLLGVFVIEMLFGRQLVSLAARLYGRSYSAVPTGAYSLFIMYVAIWTASVIFIDSEHPWSMYSNLILLGAMIQGLGAYHASIGRVGYYFSVTLCVLIPHIIEKCSHNWSLKALMHVMLIVFCLLFFYKNTGGGYLSVCPYVPFWK